MTHLSTSLSRSTGQKGYILPAAILVSVAIMTIIVTALQMLAGSSTAQNDEYYNTLVREAAQAGIIHANACIADGQVSFTRLETGSDCIGNLPVDTSKTVAKKDNWSSSYVVTKVSNVIKSEGKLNLYKSATSTVTVGSSFDATVSTVVKTTDASTAAQPITQIVPSSVATGGEHTCAVSTGQVYCWGSNARGQIGRGGAIGGTVSSTPTLVTGGLTGKTVTAVEVGADHSCAIAENTPATSTNEVWCWGYNWWGGTGDGTNVDRSAPVKVLGLNGKHVTRINIGTNDEGNNGCAVTDETAPQAGFVTNMYCWGNNSQGQLGQGNQSNVMGGALRVKDPSNKLTGKTVVDVALGQAHTCAVTDDGMVHCWGNNNVNSWGGVGNFGLGSTASTIQSSPGDPIPTTAFGNRNAVRIASGNNTTCVIAGSDKVVYCWGNNGSGQLGDNTNTNRSSPVLTLADAGGQTTNDVTDIDIDSATTCAIVGGAAKCWGANDADAIAGQLGIGVPGGYRMRPQTVVAPVAGKTAISIDTGFQHACVVANNAIYCWGRNTNGQLGTGFSSGTTPKPSTNAPVAPADSPMTLGGNDFATSVSAGADHSCAIIGSKAYCWGSNSDGQLGNNLAGSQSRPVLVKGALDGKKVLKITAGAQFTCAVIETNQIYCWGRNTYGQLGNGTTASSSSPALVSTAAGSGLVAWISAGTDHVCSVIYNPTINTPPNMPAYCWGRNNSRQIGDGDASAIRPTPSRVTGSMAIATASAGKTHSCLTTTNDNTLYCWGVNGTYGVVGNNGAAATIYNPTRISTGAVGTAKVSAVSTGANFSCVTMQTNKNVCWGLGINRQLANNSIITSKIPVVSSNTGAMSGKTVVKTSVGDNNACSITTDNSLICWGMGANKQLGDNTTTDREPIKINTGGMSEADKIPSARTVTDVSVGAAHACAIADGLIYCWGVNTSGQLGLGVNSPSNPPTQIPSYVPVPGAVETTEPSYIAY